MDQRAAKNCRIKLQDFPDTTDTCPHTHTRTELDLWGLRRGQIAAG